MPKVSVIVPNYNHAPYLRQRIESILNQTYQDFELILLDDCSTDNSRDILNSYSNQPKVSHCIFNAVNSKSAFRQWQKGVQLAKGEYIWIAESDDWAEPEFLEVLVEKMDANAFAGLAYCNSSIYKNELLVNDFSAIKSKRFQNNHWSDDYFSKGKDEIQNTLVWECSINNASAVVMRRNILIDVLPHILSFRYSGDWYCYLRIADLSDIIYVNKRLNNYRDHDHNVSKQAGYNYIMEAFKIYSWLRKLSVWKSTKVVKTAFHTYISNIYSTGLDYNFMRDIKYLLPIDSRLFVLMSIKLWKRKMKNLKNRSLICH